MRFTTYRSAVVLLAAIALAGCGAGSNADPEADPTGAPKKDRGQSSGEAAAPPPGDRPLKAAGP